MLGEDEEPTEEEDSLMAEGKLLAVMKKVAIPKLPKQQKKVTAWEAAGHTSEAGEMAEAEDLVINVTGATSGGIDLLSVLKRNKLDREAHMMHN